ncbi:MAG: MBL fold metallo-hydrolase, partial [Myxococcota bacterium]
MMAKPFASSEDTVNPNVVIDEIAPGVFARTAGGDPTMGAVEGEDFWVCIEAGATPFAARRWVDELRSIRDKPIRFLVLSHYHAVRVLGAAAFDAQWVVASDRTKRWIQERGQADWDSEAGRMPRLFEKPESIPGLTHPTLTFSDSLTIELGAQRGVLELRWMGRGHTEGDIVAWLPKPGVVFTGDLVESEAALYTGDAFHLD